MIFTYGQGEMGYLRQCDRAMAALIDQFGFIERSVKPDLFSAILSSIVSQQISSKAAVTVWGRFADLCGAITPALVERLPVEDIQKCGMSSRKVGYIKGIAQAVISGALNLDALHDLSDEAVIKILSDLNGIGVWTAEMLLLFSLQRPDVLSYGDLAIRKGICQMHGLESVSKKEFQTYRARYSPYGSVASFYIWQLANPL